MQVTACTSFSIAISNEGISTDFRDLHRRSNETAPFYNWLGSAAAAAWPIAARAQQSDQPRRIGALMGSDESDPEAQSEITEFRRAFQDLGWTGGHNVRIADCGQARACGAGAARQDRCRGRLRTSVPNRSRASRFQRLLIG
jgi:hypothetical protein